MTGQLPPGLQFAALMQPKAGVVRQRSAARVGWLPTPEQERWLRLALVGGHEPGEDVASSSADPAFVRLAPLILRTAGPQLESHHRALLRDQTRHCWVTSTALLTATVPTLAHLRAQGFDVCVLKGAALHTLAYGGDVSLRPIDDIDMLVRGRDAATVTATLVSLGYRTGAKIDSFGPGRFASYAGANFDRGRNEGLDVHWRLSHWQRDPGLHDRMLDRSVPFDLRGVSMSTLSRTDHLLHAMVHGAGHESAVATLRWAADATLLIRNASPADPIDWDLLAEEAERAHFVLPVRDALRWLADALDVDVPESIHRRLAVARVDRVDRIVRSIRERQPTRRSMATRLFLADYAIRTSGAPAFQRLIRYPSYLRDSLRDGDRSALAGLIGIARDGIDSKRA